MLAIAIAFMFTDYRLAGKEGGIYEPKNEA
jgi:hypothetical protein